jgi:replicative DNA helicase
VRKKVQDFIGKARRPGGEGAKFLLQEFPSGMLTVSELRRLLERWKAKGTKLDMLIVDYADLMAPERITESSVENSKSVYVNLRGLAMQEDLAVLTATQTNRQGYTAAVARAEHVSDDFNKIRIADVVISINKTEEERTAKQCRLYFAACRNNESGFTLRVEQAPDRMKFISKVPSSASIWVRTWTEKAFGIGRPAAPAACSSTSKTARSVATRTGRST